MLTSSLLAQPKIATSRATAQLSNSPLTMNIVKANQPAARAAGFSGLSASNSHRRLVAVSAEGDQKNSGPMKKLQNSLGQHWKDLRAEINEIKDQELAPFKEGVEELKNWAEEIEKTTQAAAPSFLKPSATKNQAANAALDQAFLSAMDTLAQGADAKPSVLILDSKSPFLARKENFDAHVELLDDLPEKPVDAIVVDGLLNQPLQKITDQVNKATALLPAQSKLVVVSQVNPDQSGSTVANYVVDLVKSQATAPLGRAIAAGLEIQGFEIESNTQADGVNTIIARKKDGVMAEISSNISKRVEEGVDLTTQQFQKIMNPSKPDDSSVETSSKGNDTP